MERGLPIREDVATPSELRSLAKKEPRRRTAQRMLAIANALEGMRRADAARAAGIERQSRRDAVIRFNAEGLSGLVDRPHGHRREVLSEQAMLVHRVLVGPDPERGEPSSWTLPDLCRFIEERFGKTMCPQSMSRVVRRLGLSRQKARPPEARCPGRRALRQKGLRDTVAAAAETHPGKQVVLWFMDEARVGQKGRTGHRWWMRGERPPGLCDKRFASADIFAAVRPATGQDFAARTSPWSCRGCARRPWTASSPTSPRSFRPTRRPSWCWTAPAGTMSAPSRSRPTSRLCRCRPTARS
jgi:transposase